jgi:hypothetical protein
MKDYILLAYLLQSSHLYLLYPRALSGIRASTSKRLVMRYLLLCVKLVTHPNTSKTLEG